MKKRQIEFSRTARISIAHVDGEGIYYIRNMDKGLMDYLWFTTKGDISYEVI